VPDSDPLELVPDSLAMKFLVSDSMEIASGKTIPPHYALLAGQLRSTPTTSLFLLAKFGV
jgi:hypothetical protein